MHDFKLYKRSKTHIHLKSKVLVDTGYQGLQKLHKLTEIPKKKSKKHPLTKEMKQINREISSQRVLNENVLASLKTFKIIAEKYRNRRKRFGLRFNLIAAIYNNNIQS